jgi:hypothetical protein
MFATVAGALALPMPPAVTVVPALITSEPFAASATVVAPTPFGVLSEIAAPVGTPSALSVKPEAESRSAQDATAHRAATLKTIVRPEADVLANSPIAALSRGTELTTPLRQ